MTSNSEDRDEAVLRAPLGRRKFFAMGATAVATIAAGTGAAAALIRVGGDDPTPRSKVPPGLSGLDGRDPNAVPAPPKGVRYLALAGTDGWATLPCARLVGDADGVADIGPYFPDPLADPFRTTYVFSFRNVTGLDRETVAAQKGRTQLNAPLFFATVGEELWVTLTNLGLQLRPDLVDGHTLHWHGFRNAIPFYDGVPESSISVPIGHDFTYVYRPRDAGTYMYHCHFEDVEHVTMGMQGIVFVKPDPDTYTDLNGREWAYGPYDGDSAGDSAYDRQYAVLLSEIDARAHFNDAHIQATDWTDFHAEFSTMNGRSWPDTTAPNGIRLANGDLRARIDGGSIDSAGVHVLSDAAAGTVADRLASNPNSSLVEAKSGERILIRLVNLGFFNRTFLFPGLDVSVVGRDGRFVPSPARRTNTDSVQIGPGESRDIVFTAPTVASAVGTYQDFPWYDRDMTSYPGSKDHQHAWVGGARSVVRVWSENTTLAAQLKPNGWAGEGAWDGEQPLEAKYAAPPTVNVSVHFVNSQQNNVRGRYLVGSIGVAPTTQIDEVRWWSTTSSTPPGANVNWYGQSTGAVAWTGTTPSYTVPDQRVASGQGGQRYYWVKATDFNGRSTIVPAGRA